MNKKRGKGWFNDRYEHALASKGFSPRSNPGIDVGDEYYHVRQRNPDRYSKIRIPDWANKPAQSISKDAQVKMGKLKGEDEWEVQSVLITAAYHSKEEAEELADRIRKKIEGGE